MGQRRGKDQDCGDERAAKRCWYCGRIGHTIIWWAVPICSGCFSLIMGPAGSADVVKERQRRWTWVGK